MKPQVIAAAISDLLSDDAILSTDSWTITTWAARDIQMKRQQMFSCSGNIATMAPGLPYTIAAHIAYPGRQCVAFVGDGGFTMLMGELAHGGEARAALPHRVILMPESKRAEP